jgi:co-chaperonin GroES (HSP10)
MARLIRPLHDRVVIKRAEEKEQKKSPPAAPEMDY